jgi:protein pelota
MPETEDDLWYLAQIIMENDYLEALTFRRVESRSDAIRPESAEKRPVILGIRVKSTEFKEFGNVLRVTGIIEKGDVGLGSFHTINIEPGKDFLLKKDVWHEGIIKLLDEAKNAKRIDIFFVSIDDQSAVMAVLTPRGLKQIAEVHAHISGKFIEVRDDKAKTEFYAEILKILLANTQPNTVIAILGPGFWKEDFLGYIKENAKQIAERCTLLSASNAGLAGINEVLRKDIALRGLNEAKVKIETAYVEQFFAEIARNGNVVYGIQEVQRAIEMGAGATLLICDRLLRKAELSTLLKNAGATRCKIVVISTAHDAGKRFMAIGGIGLFLRYKIHEV